MLRRFSILKPANSVDENMPKGAILAIVSSYSGRCNTLNICVRLEHDKMSFRLLTIIDATPEDLRSNHPSLGLLGHCTAAGRSSLGGEQ
jgi:hypothetical protein